MMIVRNCLRLASLRAGFRFVKAFTGAAICTTSVAIVRSSPGVLRCVTTTCTPSYSSRSLFPTDFSARRNKTRDHEHQIVSHIANPINRYLDYEDNSSKSLEEITREQRKRLHAIQKARAARDFHKGSDKRTLPWDTIDQIRYLKQESPSEWSVATLAKSFNVSEEVIVKVLKSKFTPSSKVRHKQDKVAAENSDYQASAVKTRAVVSGSKHTATSGLNSFQHAENIKSESAKQRIMSDPKQSRLVRSEIAQREMQHQHRMTDGSGHLENKQGKTKGFLLMEDAGQDSMKETEVEFTFGRFDFENVESLMGQVMLKPQIIRKGRNFYNEDGQFLYRI